MEKNNSQSFVFSSDIELFQDYSFSGKAEYQISANFSLPPEYKGKVFSEKKFIQISELFREHTHYSVVKESETPFDFFAELLYVAFDKLCKTLGNGLSINDITLSKNGKTICFCDKQSKVSWQRPCKLFAPKDYWLTKLFDIIEK